jgi:glycosyltransferase involved in cell wall biosynthesis
VADSPDVSVVIPAFNAEATVGAAVESVLTQEGARFEVLVVDDGSRDGTSDVVRSVATRAGAPAVRILEHTRRENRGVGASRNVAIAAARAPLVALLDADDRLLPGSLASRLEVFRSYPELAFVYGRVQRPDPTEMQGTFVGAGIPGRPAELSVWLLFENPVVTSTVMLRRSALPDPPFPERFPPEMVVGEDWTTYLEASRRGPAFFLDRELAVYQQAPTSYSRALGDRRVRHAQLCGEAAIVRSFAARHAQLQSHVEEALAYRSGIVLVEAFGLAARLRFASFRRCMASARTIAGRRGIYLRGLCLWVPRLKVRSWFGSSRRGPAWSCFTGR